MKYLKSWWFKLVRRGPVGLPGYPGPPGITGRAGVCECKQDVEQLKSQIARLQKRRKL